MSSQRQVYTIRPRLMHLHGRRAFGLSLGALLVAACSRKTPKVPTRAAPASPKATGTPELHAEILDTEEGPVLIDDHDPQLGPREAPCVVITFSDFQCPFCADIAKVLARIRRESGKSVRIVFKHLPLPFHHEAKEAAIASQVVFLEAGSDAFWRFHDRAFAHPHDIDSSVLTNWARDEGVKAEQIAARAKDAEKRVADDMLLAERLGIRGTPHLYVNARAIAGAFPYEQMRTWVDEEL